MASNTNVLTTSNKKIIRTDTYYLRTTNTGNDIIVKTIDHDSVCCVNS